MKIGNRLDGHIVQGHVDQVGICKKIIEENGSWYFSFEYKKSENITIEKGSIAINGVSLTVVNSKRNAFSVAIKEAKKLSKDTIVIINSCGDAYKDRGILEQKLGKKYVKSN